MDLQKVIDDAKPMLEEFLSDVGLYRSDSPLDCAQLLEPFSNWIDAQEVTEGDRYYLASRLAAFICEYLIQVRSGSRVIEGGRIKMRIPLQQGIVREFDPYAVAISLATNRDSLKAFLDTV
jgi:hypothetical protein